MKPPDPTPSTCPPRAAATPPRAARQGSTKLRRVAVATRSGLKRYPRALLESVRNPFGVGWVRPAGAEGPLLLDRHDLATVWLGHATVLMRLGSGGGGLTILTDPVLSERIGMSLGGVTLGLPRLMPMPLSAEQLPPIDLILISHAHFDHLDKPTLRRLAAAGGERTTVVTARQTARLIPPGFGRVVELDWGEGLMVEGVELTAMRPRHWGARTALDRRRGYNSYVIQTDSRRVLFAGDTAYTDAFDSLEGVSLAVLGIGSYAPWEHAHATPEQAWAMFRSIGARHMLPVHHSTFALGDEHVDEPMERLLEAAGAEMHRIVEVEPGAVWAGGPEIQPEPAHSVEAALSLERLIERLHGGTARRAG